MFAVNDSWWVSFQRHSFVNLFLEHWIIIVPVLHLDNYCSFGGAAGCAVIRRLHAKLKARLNLAVQRLCSGQPAGCAVDGKRQRLRTFRGINDRVAYPGVFALVAVVRLDADYGVADWNIFGHGFLEILRVELGRVVVHICYFDDHLKYKKNIYK